MPRRKRHPDPTNPEHYVHFLQRGMMQWDPQIVPALLAWLAMHEQILTDRRAETAGMAHGLPAAVRDGMIRQLDSAIAGVRTVALMAGERWKRMEWYRALARVQQPETGASQPDQSGTPRAG